ncbi:Uncharacterized protein BM_BM1291 [Brugia malayi]|uniref:Uncharacterized protein n=1 Tax=Brugia malayi TaxID=6279 RepID=A0A4E9F2F5_BRUMA|nr:Uncharacterized protein BM_BM1291 [Brugia malayi]VIO90408.1 Uncharacterized protein BM_BM1291 [Brugia malayi]
MVVLNIITLISINYPIFDTLNYSQRSNIIIKNASTLKNVTNENDKFTKLLKSYEQTGKSLDAFSVKLRNNLKANFNRAKKEIALLNLDNLRELTTSSSTTLQMGTTAPNLKATALTKLTTPANNSEQKLFMENLEETTLSLSDETEYENIFQRIDNVTIGLVIGISIVLFLIIIINCFTFRIYLKERKDDDRSFQSDDTTESSSDRTLTTNRQYGGCSPRFAYQFYDDSI